MNTANLTLRQLRAFVLVARHGSFTHAAQAMHLTQSALSLLIRELESAMDTRLINRTTRSVSLTEVGTEFLATAQRLLDDLSHALANVDSLRAKERGRVVIAAPLVLSGTFLPPILASFRARFPGVELVLRDSLPEQVLPHVRSGAADLGIGTFHQLRSDLHSVLLFRESLVAVLPREGGLAAVAERRTLTWKALSALPVLALPHGSVFRELAESGFGAAGHVLRPVFEATYVGTLIGLVRAGMGVAVVPGYATALADPAQLQWRRITQPVVEREVLMVRRMDRALSHAALALHEHVMQAMRRSGRGAQASGRVSSCAT